MVQKYIYIKVLKVFFEEPNEIHFIKEISRKINLAHTSVRLIIKDLISENLILKKKSKPFDGYVANRENDDFIYYKKIYNLFSLNELKKELIETIAPNAIVLFGSYSKGEDIESSDIDILILSKSKKEINVSNFEKKLKRMINIMQINNLSKLDKNIIKKINNGIILYGEI